MALPSVSMAFFLSIVILSLSLEIAASHHQIVSGKVLCSDCDNGFNFSGIKIMIRCDDGTKNFLTATTNKIGRFKVELPSKFSYSSSSSSSCMAKLHGGPMQLYASKKHIASNIVRIEDHSDSYVLSSPLIISTVCPTRLRSMGKCGGAGKSLWSSKTIDLPVPPEWGLAPTSYYLPFLPIIGIP